MRIAFREGGAVDFNLLNIIDGILNIKYMQIYWFFIPLFAVYLAISILSGIQDKLKIFTYGSILGILLVAVMPLLSKLFGIPYNSGLTPGVVNGYILLSMICLLYTSRCV